MSILNIITNTSTKIISLFQLLSSSQEELLTSLSLKQRHRRNKNLREILLKYTPSLRTFMMFFILMVISTWETLGWNQDLIMFMRLPK